MGLLNAIGNGDSGHWCCVDESGNVLHVSTGLSALVKIPKDQIRSLFQFNPEWSFLQWKELFDTFSASEINILESKYLTGAGEVIECQIQLIPFSYDNKRYIQYAILPDIIEIKVDELRKTKAQGKIGKVSYSYDDVAPNPVLYFDKKGKIVYVNEKMRLLNDPEVDKASVEDLFLESELGPLLAGLKKYESQDQQLMVRLIMKAKAKLKAGYARISFHFDDRFPANYRLEFVLKEKAQFVDQSMEEILDELEKLKNEIEDTKSTIISEQLMDFSFENIITKSPKYKAVLRQIAQVADTDTTVLITGETGTGKELLCDATYKLSDRSDKRIVKVNCASIPENLMESILFGHEKGSFTGADSRKLGKFEIADGGTIFLDEIGELPLSLQPKLLRVIQEGEIERIGNPNPIQVDVRIIAATNRDLEAMTKQGKFRQDLYYRLNVFPIYNIPLKERLEDIPLLIEHFIKKVNNKTGRNVTRIKNKDLNALSNYHFPGNVRELENIIERSIILAEGEELNMDFFYQNSSYSKSENKVFTTHDEMIKHHIIRALEKANGKVTGKSSASELLGLKGKTLASKLKKYEINPKAYMK